MLNEQQRQDLQGIAGMGRNEDTFLAHVAPDEMVVPAQVLKDDPLLNTYIRNSISKYGIDPNQFVVGNGDMDLNPLTGLPEFGVFSKLVKKIKKVVKKVVKPVAQVAQFVPGPWQAPAALISKASTVYDVAKGRASPAALLSVAGPLRVGPGIGESLGAIQQAGGLGATLSSIPGALKSGIGSFIKDPLGSVTGLFGGGGGQTTVQSGDTLSSIAAKEGTTVAELLKANPQITNPNLIQAGATLNLPGAGGLSRFGGGLQRIGQGIGSLVGGPQVPEGLEPIMGTDPNTGATVLQGYKDAAGNMYSAEQGMNLMSGDRSNIFRRVLGSTPGQSRLGVIEDIIRGKTSDPIRQGGGLIDGFLGGSGQQTGQAGIGGLFGGMGGNLGAAALAGLLGKVAYESAKERMGGLAETPAVTMDPLGRYQLSKALGTGGTREEFGLGPAPVALQFAKGGEVRKHFNQGGLAMVEELDMRDGGESSGPGTGTSDDIPAMLSDGEFVMTAKAVKNAGSFTTKKTPKGIELIGGGKSSRAEGVKNMRELMNMFEAV